MAKAKKQSLLEKAINNLVEQRGPGRSLESRAKDLISNAESEREFAPAHNDGDERTMEKILRRNCKDEDVIEAAMKILFEGARKSTEVVAVNEKYAEDEENTLDTQRIAKLAFRRMDAIYDMLVKAEESLVLAKSRMKTIGLSREHELVYTSVRKAVMDLEDVLPGLEMQTHADDDK